MKINSCNNLALNNSSGINKETLAQRQNPNFKGAAKILDGSGWLMNKIENGGFLVLFLIQDFMGMTLPRTYAGFLRDKDATGEYNIQEGFEVLGRESLTGPCMMAVAPVSLVLASKFGRSTSVNSELIKYYGNGLKEFVSRENFDGELLKKPEEFKTKFFKENVERILKSSLGENKYTPKDVDFVMEKLTNIENIPQDAKLKKFRGKAKYKSSQMREIVEYINNLTYNNGDDLNMLEKVKLGNSKVFKTQDALEGLLKYSNDTITTNKKLEKLNDILAESLKNKALGKRLITNISILAATLGVLFALPKIYARSDVAPGARKKCPETNEQQDSNVSFKGKYNPIENIGKIIGKNKNDFVSSELEYNGHNFTNTLMAGLSMLGLLLPRGLRAYNRAQVDDSGKKDLTELWEILTRDLTSSLAVIFVVPMLTRALISSYEKNSGYVLLNKDRTLSKSKSILKLLNPYSNSHVLSNAEINAIYDNINSKQKMLNFCDYINKNNGDLEKIIRKSENYESLFNFDELFEGNKNLTKAEKNSKIKSFIEKLEEKGGKTADELIKNVMKYTEKSGRNKIASVARGLNSLPGLITTFAISPYILGWAIPRLTYRNTRRIHEKEDREQQKLKASA